METNSIKIINFKNIIEMKKCNTCENIKHNNEFWDDKRNSDGKKGQCVKCITDKRKQRKEEIKLYNKKYRQLPVVKKKNRKRSIENWEKRQQEKQKNMGLKTPKRPNTSSTMKHFTKEEKLGKEMKEAGDMMMNIMQKFIQEQNLMISKSILLNADPPIEGTIKPEDLVERDIQMKHEGDQMWLEQRGVRISPFMVSTVNHRNGKQ